VLNNPYDVLGLTPDASEEEVKAAYRRLALKDHPDRNPGDAVAEERFKRATEAYSVLRDPDRRARFDRYGAEPERPAASGVDWQTVFQEAMRGQGVEGFDPRAAPRTGNPLFDTLFGAVTGMIRQAGLLPGEHRELTAELPVTLLRGGGSVRVHVPGPSVCAHCHGDRTIDGAACPTCGGSGVRARGGLVEVAVPAGVRPGARLRLPGLGGPGQPPGDVFVTLGVALPEGVRLEGNDLHTDLFLTPLEAANGTMVDVIGVGLEVPAGSRDGASIRIGGAGLGGGDMIVTLKQDVWRGLWRGVRDRFSGSR
jgi:DnaJ-class molecular chaperone